MANSGSEESAEIVEPYQFEPQARVIDRSLSDSTEGDDDHQVEEDQETVCNKNKLCGWLLLFCVHWCQCGHCEQMSISREKLRVLLPSCAVNKIRSAFPSSSYAGFKYPNLGAWGLM